MAYNPNYNLESVPESSVLSVSGVNRLAKSLLEGHFPNIVVEGEISNLSRPASGHWYFTLKDRSAQLRCAMFAGSNKRVRFAVENGQQLTLRGRLTVYEGRGDYQLIAESMTEAGAGALQRAFELLKAKLEEEGLFNAERKRTLQDDYQHIGLITSRTGAAVQDIFSVFARRSPSTRLTLLPVSVQGAQAPAEIVTAIQRANKLADQLGIEALIVGRGGGSIEDLQAFNDEKVARAIAASSLPICSAVGHETDFTIADFVADLRAPTPSAAAEQLSQNQEDLLVRLRQLSIRLSQLQRSALQRLAHKLSSTAKRLRRPDRLVQEQAQQLDGLDARLMRGWAARSAERSNELALLAQSLRAQSPRRRLERLTQDLSGKKQRLSRAAKVALQRKGASLAQLGRSLEAISPLSTLARGYSISFDADGNALRSIEDTAPGKEISTQVGDGRIVSLVKETAKSTDKTSE